MAGIVEVNGGLLAQLDYERTHWLATLRMGLFQNDWDPTWQHTIAQVEPATFSGYDGPHDLVGWTAAVLTGRVATTTGVPRVWNHDGGAVANWIFGYYVIAADGSLVWAERSARAPELVGPGSPPYTVVPRYGLRSRFPAGD